MTFCMGNKVRVGAAMVLLCHGFVLASSARADSGSATDMNTPTAEGRTGRRGGGKRVNPDKGGRSAGTISGNCSTVESPMNPLAGACVNTLLALNDEKGAEVSKTRTNIKGDFEFAGEPSKAYHLVSGSQYYEVVSPTAFVHGGDHVTLKLRQK